MLRFFIVRNHYRSSQNYAPDNLIDAQVSLDRLYQTLQSIPPAAVVAVGWAQPEAQAFRAAMNDDFNSAGAVAALFELAAQANRGNDAAISAQLRALGGVLGLLQQEPGVYFQSPTRYTRRAIAQAAAGQAVPSEAGISESEIASLIEARTEAKQAKNFAMSDAIRAKLKTAGIELDDKPGGLTQWRRA